jgi:decaprenylphospho-beta-D-ribofuranose 2-oxidase
LEKLTVVSGWSGAYFGKSRMVSVYSEEDCLNVIKKTKYKNFSIASYGSGNSFGDMIVNENEIILNCRGMNKVKYIDYKNGVIEVESGFTIRDLLGLCMPSGWIPSSIPGSLDVTIGGAIANNVHGKDSSMNGNFGNQVLWIDLMVYDGTIMRLSRDENIDLFLATIGGMGLTGIILSAKLKLKKIPSIEVLSNIQTTNCIEETLELSKSIDNCDFFQCWVDALSAKKTLGKSVIMKAKFSKVPSRDNEYDIEQSLMRRTKIFNLIPSNIFWRASKFLFYPPFISKINYLYWKKADIFSSNNWNKLLFTKYFFFHNNIPDFYSVYRPPGFVEIQALIPTSVDPKMYRILIKKAQENGLIPVLSGLKKAIPDDYTISFQDNAFNISFDFPIRNQKISELKKATFPIFKLIAELGGKVNLSKDQLMPTEMFRVYYKNYEKFWDIKRKVDPNNLFLNDMARRLFLTKKIN